eukprot:Polyplicarium_translucidae@DN3082_c0_g2_i3.p1
MNLVKENLKRIEQALSVDTADTAPRFQQSSRSGSGSDDKLFSTLQNVGVHPENIQAISELVNSFSGVNMPPGVLPMSPERLVELLTSAFSQASVDNDRLARTMQNWKSQLNAYPSFMAGTGANPVAVPGIIPTYPPAAVPWNQAVLPPQYAWAAQQQQFQPDPNPGYLGPR